MKTSAPIVLAALLTLLAPPAAAEPPPRPNEFHFALGDRGAMYEISDGFSDMFLFIFTIGHLSYGETEGPPQFTAGYERWVSSWASLGVSGAYVTAHRTVFWDGVARDEEEHSLVTTMVDVRAHWLRRTNVQLYSGVSLGGAFWSSNFESEDESDSDLAFQVTPIGIRVGRNTGVYAEFGLGHNSVVRGGLSQRF